MIKTETATEINKLNLHDTPKGSIKEYWLNLIISEIGASIRVPIMVARGVEEGPVVGLTAAIGGNELNGIPVIQELFM